MPNPRRIIQIHVKSPDGCQSAFYIGKKKVWGDMDRDDGLPLLNRNIDGEDIDMKIDVDTGKIIDWKKPTKESINDILTNYGDNEEEEEEEDNRTDDEKCNDRIDNFDDNFTIKVLNEAKKEQRKNEKIYATVLKSIAKNSLKKLRKK